MRPVAAAGCALSAHCPYRGQPHPGFPLAKRVTKTSAGTGCAACLGWRLRPIPCPPRMAWSRRHRKRTPRSAAAPLGPRARARARGGRRTAPARLAAASCAHRRPHSVRPTVQLLLSGAAVHPATAGPRREIAADCEASARLSRCRSSLASKIFSETTSRSPRGLASRSYRCWHSMARRYPGALCCCEVARCCRELSP